MGSALWAVFFFVWNLGEQLGKSPARTESQIGKAKVFQWPFFRGYVELRGCILFVLFCFVLFCFVCLWPFIGLGGLIFGFSVSVECLAPPFSWEMKIAGSYDPHISQHFPVFFKENHRFQRPCKKGIWDLVPRRHRSLFHNWHVWFWNVVKSNKKREDTKEITWSMKKSWLFRVYMGSYYPVIWGL